jgi:RNA polymerase sigma-70 factor (ECF subfamily)
VERSAFDALVAELRPQLHRYCARMSGSVIDGEDVLQDALLKATEALPRAAGLANPGGWLFRIAHNAALDFLRRRARREAPHDDEDFAMLVDPEDPVRDREIVAASLRTFMRLPVAQRSSVILKDVLDYSVQEVSEIVGGTVPAVKSALQRGRARLHELAGESDDAAPATLSDADRARLREYIERFNAHDVDAIRSMLADDVRLDLVNRLQLRGREEVGQYFHRYATGPRWRFVPGLVDGRPAILAFDPNDGAERPSFFILLAWADGAVVGIRDFLFARYVVEGAEVVVDGGPNASALPEVQP